MIYDDPIGTMFDLEFEPTHAAASEARQTTRGHLERAGVAPPVVADLELVIAELASNAVEQRPSASVRLTVSITDTEAVVTMANEAADVPLEHGSGRVDEERPDGRTLAERGWGLGIVEALTDGVWVDHIDGWTVVSCRRRLGPPGA